MQVLNESKLWARVYHFMYKSQQDLCLKSYPLDTSPSRDKINFVETILHMSLFYKSTSRDKVYKFELNDIRIPGVSGEEEWTLNSCAIVGKVIEFRTQPG